MSNQQEPIQSLIEEVYDIIKDIKDPEKDQTLEELDVVKEELVTVSQNGQEEYIVKIEFVPTVPHCTLATLIGLCLRVKLQRSLPWPYKLDIIIAEGTHSTGDEINKQINDKERVAAAMENPELIRIVESCIMDREF